MTVEVERKDGSKASFAVTARLDTPVDINYYRNGGILQTVLRKMLYADGPADLPRRGADGDRVAVPARGAAGGGSSWTPGCSRARRRCACATGRSPEFDPATVDAMVLTHTHLDHIGRVPRLVKQGFRGPIYCTPPTKELAEILLLDAAHLQQEDAEYLNRKGLTKHSPALPLFDETDVRRGAGALPAPCPSAGRRR